MITIINYGLGNIKAFTNIFYENKIPFRIAEFAEDLKNTSKIILPGVGAFDYAMKKLHHSGMKEKLDELVLQDKIPVLGVCVGMQILANNSEEGDSEGLGYISGTVKKISADSRNFLPHMGWNTVLPQRDHPFFNGMQNDPLFYFLHSFYFDCENADSVLATTKYTEEFTSAVSHENTFGVQFHPEKSHDNGRRLLLNFVNHY